ncbi:MAG: type II toxin-antitoxin system VapC family toxin [Bacteroidota bacterium]
MTYILDTNVLLWALENNPRLSSKARKVMVNPNNEIHVSIASIWEISIKLSIGKLNLSRTLDEILEEMEELDFRILPISIKALRYLRNMPFHHKDPFDRLIISQAIASGVTCIASDEKFSLYNPKIIW